MPGPVCGFFTPPEYTRNWIFLDVLISQRVSPKLLSRALDVLLFASICISCLRCLQILWAVPAAFCHFPQPEMQAMPLFPTNYKLGRTETNLSGSSQTSCNIANKVCFTLSGTRERSGSWAAISSRPRLFHIREGMEQGWAKMSQNVLPFRICLFLIGNLFGCCQPLTTFQSSYTVTVASH